MTLLDEAYEYVLAEYGQKGYEFWRRLIGKDSIIIPHPRDSAKEIEITPRWETKPNGVILVLVSTLHTTRFGITLPTTFFLVRSDDSVEIRRNPPQALPRFLWKKIRRILLRKRENKNPCV